MQQILFSYFLVKNAMSYRIIYELKDPKQAMKIQNYSL